MRRLERANKFKRVRSIKARIFLLMRAELLNVLNDPRRITVPCSTSFGPLASDCCALSTRAHAVCGTTPTLSPLINCRLLGHSQAVLTLNGPCSACRAGSIRILRLRRGMHRLDAYNLLSRRRVCHGKQQQFGHLPETLAARHTRPSPFLLMALTICAWTPRHPTPARCGTESGR